MKVSKKPKSSVRVAAGKKSLRTQQLNVLKRFGLLSGLALGSYLVAKKYERKPMFVSSLKYQEPDLVAKMREDYLKRKQNK
jgi:hypothetical protein